MSLIVEIIPAIQVKTRNELQDKLNRVKGLVRRVNIDIVGEEFEKNKGIEVEDLAEVNTDLILDIQLMIKDPIRYLNKCYFVGCERVYGHVEQMQDQREFVETTTDLGMQVGLGLDIHTPTAAIEEMLGYLDGVLLMAVEVGFSGQEFDLAVLAKIEELKEKEFKGDICIDGGLNKDLIRLCKEKGANHFAVGSYIWKARNIESRVEELKIFK